LPEATSYNLPGLPAYSKITAISLGLLFGSFLTLQRNKISYKWKLYDTPIIVWCLFCPIATSLSNKLGFYDGISGALGHIIMYGVPYFVGRLYFNNPKALKDLCVGIIIGGIIYLPLCLFEIRMAPKLHRLFYGFDQSNFYIHVRYGGYRPMVFMQMGLMVALWMAISTTITFWYYRAYKEKHIIGIPIFLIVAAMAVTTILCKSANGWTVLALGICSCVLYQNFNAIRPFKLLLLVVPIYCIVRATGIIASDEILDVARYVFDEARISSLSDRLGQEDLISLEAMKRPFLGWGVSSLRGMPIDPDTGERIRSVRDALWLIAFQSYGFIGLFSLFCSLLLGPWLILKKSKKLLKTNIKNFIPLAIALSLVVIFFSIDSLLNGMLSPLYILISGALISIYIEIFQNPTEDL